MGGEPKHGCVHVMAFVDDLRYNKPPRGAPDPFERGELKMDALLASTAEALCDEMGIPPPQWLSEVPACEKPFFVGEIENLKAMSIVQSPLRFRIRKIFVLENFLSRV